MKKKKAIKLLLCRANLMLRTDAVSLMNLATDKSINDPMLRKLIIEAAQQQAITARIIGDAVGFNDPIFNQFCDRIGILMEHQDRSIAAERSSYVNGDFARICEENK